MPTSTLQAPWRAGWPALQDPTRSSIRHLYHRYAGHDDPRCLSGNKPVLQVQKSHPVNLSIDLIEEIQYEWCRCSFHYVDMISPGDKTMNITHKSEEKNIWIGMILSNWFLYYSVYTKETWNYLKTSDINHVLYANKKLNSFLFNLYIFLPFKI